MVLAVRQRRRTASHSAGSLLVLDPPPSQNDIEPLVLLPGEHVVGSGTDCALWIPVEGVETQHCVITVDERRMTVRAIDPRTWLNDGPVRQSPLRPGDRLAVGPVELRIRKATRADLRAAWIGAGFAEEPPASDATNSPGGPGESAAGGNATAADQATMRNQLLYFKRKLRDQQVELAKLRKQADEATRRDRHLKDREEELARRAAELERSDRQQQVELQQREASLTEREQKYATHSVNMEAERRSLEAARQALEAERGELQRERTNHEQQTRSLHEEKQAVEKDRDRVSEAIAAAERERAAAQETKATYERLCAELQSRGAAPSGEQAVMAERDAVLSQREAELAEREARHAAERQRWNEQHEQLQAERGPLQAERQAIEDLRAELVRQRAQLQSEQAELKRERDDIEAARQNLDEQARSLESARGHLASREQRLQEYERSLAQAREELERRGAQNVHDVETGTAADTTDQISAVRSSLAEMFGMTGSRTDSTPAPEVRRAERPSAAGWSEKQQPSAPAPAQEIRKTPEYQLECADDSDSMSAYMEQLLARSRRGQSASASFASEAAAPERRADRFSDWHSPESTSSARLTHGERPPIVPTEPEEPPTPLQEPLKPRQTIDKEAVRADIDSLRQVANLSARAAVAKYTWKRLRDTLFVRTVLLLVSFTIGLILLGTDAVVPVDYATFGWATILVGLILAVETLHAGWLLLMPVKERPSGEPASRPSSDTARTGPTSGEQRPADPSRDKPAAPDGGA